MHTSTHMYISTFQVFEDYGRPNHALLLVHGFSLGRENRHDCMRIDARRPAREDAGYWETLARMEAVRRGEEGSRSPRERCPIDIYLDYVCRYIPNKTKHRRRGSSAAHFLSLRDASTEPFIMRLTRRVSSFHALSTFPPSYTECTRRESRDPCRTVRTCIFTASSRELQRNLISLSLALFTPK